MKTIKNEIRKQIRDDFKKVQKSPLTHEEFKMYASQLLFIDKIQTTFKNQRRSAIVNFLIRDDELYPEICELRRRENDDEGTKTKVAQLIKQAQIRQINLQFERNFDADRVDEKTVEAHVTNLTDIQYGEDMSAQVFEMFEVDRVKDLTKYMEDNLPVYQWCKKVKGLGPKLTAKILSGIGDIRRFENPASLWSYCGVGDPAKSKRQKGVQLSHAPKMRDALHVLSESFIKQRSQYRVIYEKRKEKTVITRPEWHNLAPCPIKNVGKDAPKIDENGKVTWSNKHPKHAHIDACRVMIKRFLAELYAAWYQSLGLEPPAKPYGVEIKGHHEEPMIVSFENETIPSI